MPHDNLKPAADDLIRTLLEAWDWDVKPELAWIEPTVENIEWMLGAGEYTDALEEIGGLKGTLDDLTTASVVAARQAGFSWSEIGDALGVSLQSAWEKYRRLADVTSELQLDAIKDAERHALISRQMADWLLGNPDLADDGRKFLQKAARSEERVARVMRATARRDSQGEAPNSDKTRAGRPSGTTKKETK